MAVWPNGSTLPPNLKPGGGADPDAPNSEPNADGLIVSSEFHDADHYPSLHNGTDVVGYDGQTRAAEGGTIVRADWFSGYGRTVDVQLADRWMIRYGHLSAFAVGAGQQIGEAAFLGPWGGSGYGEDDYYGTHSHAEARDPDGNPVNFRDFMAARGGAGTSDSEDFPVNKDTARFLNSPFHVEGWYQLYLAHPSDAEGKVYWIEVWGEKGEAGAEAIFAFASATEIGHEAVVTNLYRALLNREPDAAGLQSWAVVSRAQGPKVVKDQIIGSDEYRKLHP